MRNSTIRMAENIRYAFNKGLKETGIVPADFLQLSYDLAMAVLEDAQGGSAGTHAYDMLANYAKIDLDNLESLINLTAATVLSVSEPSVDELQVTFSPKDMDDLIRNYEVTSDRDALLTKVIIKKKVPGEGLMEHGDPKGANPQVPIKTYDRPVWAIREWLNGKPRFNKMLDKADAERNLKNYDVDPERPAPTIENRMCLHSGCPSDRCLQK